MLGRQVRGRAEVVDGCYFDVLGLEVNDGRELEWRAGTMMEPEVPSFQNANCNCNPTRACLSSVEVAHDPTTGRARRKACR